jgi:hypothetical protein
MRAHSGQGTLAWRSARGRFKVALDRTVQAGRPVEALSNIPKIFQFSSLAPTSKIQNTNFLMTKDNVTWQG